MSEPTLADIFGEGAKIEDGKLVYSPDKLIAGHPRLTQISRVEKLKEIGFNISDMPKIFGETAFIESGVLFFNPDDVLTPDAIADGWLLPFCELFGCHTYLVITAENKRMPERIALKIREALKDDPAFVAGEALLREVILPLSLQEID